MMTDLARLDAIIRQLPPDDGAWLSAVLEPAWRQRERRMIVRDAAVVAAAAGMEGRTRNARAKALHRALARYLASAWAIDQRTGHPVTRNATLYRLALANEGRGLAWRRIVDILAAGRMQHSPAEAASPSP